LIECHLLFLASPFVLESRYCLYYIGTGSVPIARYSSLALVANSTKRGYKVELCYRLDLFFNKLRRVDWRVSKAKEAVCSWSQLPGAMGLAGNPC
jgi:hypothetical protein